MKDFIIGILGENSPHDFYHAFFWALVGATLSLLVHAATRNPATERTPFKFHWRVLIMDNGPRFMLAILLIIVCLRFMPELIGVKLSGFTALAVGFCWDQLAQLLKSKGMLGKFNFATFGSTPQTAEEPDYDNVCFPTIDPFIDQMSGDGITVYNTPMTGAQLIAAPHSGYFGALDENGDTVLCKQIIAGSAMPQLIGVDFPIQTAEHFIGARPERRRPRPL